MATPKDHLDLTNVESVVDQINRGLLRYADKEWNYSRITLIAKPLHTVIGPYALWVEHTNPRTKQGSEALQAVLDEIGWGERHSNELGILEIVSLRINRALLEVTTDDYWGETRPILRVERKEALEQQGVTVALWYEVQEVSGEEFENR